jgi:hypothetical protein
VSAEDLLRQGIAASKAGQKAKARELLEQAIAADEYNATAWLWLSGAVDTHEDRRICLENVLTLEPENAFAKKGLAMLGPAPEPEPAPPAVAVPPTTPQYGEQVIYQDVSTPQEQTETVIYKDASAPQAQTESVVYQDAPTPQEQSQPVLHEDTSAPPASGKPAVQPAQAVVQAEPTAAEQPTPQEDQKEQAEPKKGSTLLWVLGILALVVGIGCVGLAIIGTLVQEPSTPVDTKEAVLGVIVENIAAHNAEDIDRYMETIHRFSPARLTTRAMLETSYRNYDLSSRIYELKIIEMDKREAKVSFVLITKKIRGGAFNDNRIEGTMVLRKQGKEWKLYTQEVDEVTYLD